VDQPESEAASVKYESKVIEPDVFDKARERLAPQQNKYNGSYQYRKNRAP
jgi:hypothetical protein